MTDTDKIRDFASLQDIEKEAAAWAVRVDAGSLSPEEQSALDTWRSRSAQHEAAFSRHCGNLAAADALNGLYSPSQEFVMKPTLFERYGVDIDHRSAPIAAAVALAFIALAVIIRPFPGAPTVQEAYVTAVGMQKTIQTDDGSSTVLNTNSRLEVHLTDKERRFHLLSGEAHFTVAPDKDRPFIVFAGGRAITATGTAFAVRSEENDFQLVVTEGKVRVADQATSQSSSPTETRDTAAVPEKILIPTNLKEGDAIIIEDGESKVEALSSADINRTLSWRQGLMAFVGDPLPDVIDEISRYTDLIITIDDPALEQLRFDGYFKVGNVEALFEALEYSFDIQIEHVDQETVSLRLAEAAVE
ncbi:MAG: FecR domain-containing protein [Pseudomonadota bacterium]